MKQLEKKIQISDNRILIYSIIDGFTKYTYSIKEGFIENNKVIKTYNLSQWDDYGLNAWTYDIENNNIISFEYDENHPLYLPMFHLLNYDEELLINDDDTKEDNKRYILIYKENNIIKMNFIDLLNKPNDLDKFHIFIKNIGPDGRSKIDQYCKDTKIRLYSFFNEVYDVLTTQYHQITIEEYLLKNSPKDEYNNVKKLFKRKI